MGITVQKRMRWMLGGTLLAMTAGCTWMPWTEKEDPTILPFKTIQSGSFQGFLKNWDDARQPVFCALIRSRAQWDALMQPAATMGDQRPSGPPAAYFQTKQYLLVARVMQAPDAAERPHVFTPLSVTLREGVLRVNYLYRAPSSGASYQVKDYMMLGIPKERYTTGPVVFQENDRRVCELKR
ncbi:hypothetical protein [Herbaspirillum sp. alder98]|uniref:hypothetical protein n=1 Tax=Herbaspirillum sp. alder98 TaxID=2913096 RepID=UPI001CD8745B|nr:hypothetical protein [Herbaspirillum sp. alder98]MCA1324240.1 hypothetical protein [Herbaspirillum sp. alder98]